MSEEKRKYKGTYQMPITLFLKVKSQVKKREVV
jgi:hypothetical protein